VANWRRLILVGFVASLCAGCIAATVGSGVFGIYDSYKLKKLEERVKKLEKSCKNL